MFSCDKMANQTVTGQLKKTTTKNSIVHVKVFLDQNKNVLIFKVQKSKKKKMLLIPLLFPQRCLYRSNFSPADRCLKRYFHLFDADLHLISIYLSYEYHHAGDCLTSGYVLMRMFENIFLLEQSVCLCVCHLLSFWLLNTDIWVFPFTAITFKQVLNLLLADADNVLCSRNINSSF